MFYTIELSKGELIVVDGGWEQNADQVRKVIKDKGDHVHIWILTHPHPDHIGAFNSVWKDPQGTEIDAVYAVDIDYDSYKKNAQEWDGFPVFEEFRSITAGSDKVYYVHTGDEVNVCGLDMKVLNAYEKEKTNALTTDLANDGSMMFKLTNKKESILFCADVGVSMSDTIINDSKNDLKCDYIQMGHHGNGGLSEEFYQLTQPKLAFFDAPEWLMNPEDDSHGWTTPQNKKIMESMGAKVVYYATTPNGIELH